MKMAELERYSSTDILFPEETYEQYSEDIYSPVSAYSQSSKEVKGILEPVYSREVKGSLEPVYSAPHQNCQFRTHNNSFDISDSHLSRAKTKELSLKKRHSADEHHPESYDQQRPLPNKPHRHPRHPPPTYHSKYHPRTAAEKRRTWSPPTFERVMGSASSFHKPIRSYHSNDQLDVDNGNFYEELDAISIGPPRLAPVSGRLNQNAQKSVIRPIAFKPILPNRYVSTPRLSPPYNNNNNNHKPHMPAPKTQDLMPVGDEGYSSQDCHSHSTSNVSQASIHIDTQHYNETQYSDPHKDRPGSYNSSHHSSRLSGQVTDPYLIQTPSPSDSGVGEIEAMLREKDEEIQNLRQTMEHNETVIFRVYKEKEQNWEMEIREVHEQWELRVRQQQQKAFKMEQALLLQLFKLQQERKNTRLDMEQLRTEKEKLNQKCEDMEDDLRQTKLKLEEVQWDLCQKTGEISLLKSQLKEAKDDSSSKANESLALKSQLREIQNENSIKQKEVTELHKALLEANDQYLLAKRDLEDAKKEMWKQTKPLPSPLSPSARERSASSSSVSMLNGCTTPDCTLPLDTTSFSLTSSQDERDADQLKVAFQREREQWLQEKEKVIRYQKHLQLNYVQMVNKNKLLEKEVEQLTMELENKELELSLTESHHRTEEESVC